MSKLIIYTIVLVAAFNTLGCKKSDTPEPAEYFECYIDGQYWTYKSGGLFSSDALYARAEQLDFPHFSIEASSSNDPQTVIEFYIDNDEMATSDTIRLESLAKSYGEVYAYFDWNSSPEHRTINGKKGQLVFTKKSSSSVEGTFEMDVTNKTKVVHITKGRFKITL